MDFGEVVRVKSKFLNDSVVLYNCVRRPGYVLKLQMQRTTQTALVSTSQSNTIYGFALSSRHLYCFVMECNLQKSSF